MAPEEVGYQYRRLLDHVPTGIYECNVNCKCKSSCLNRVVQNSLTMKLQVFKTSNRGWGLRCINDIPRGSFVCVYAGHLLTEAKANEVINNFKGIFIQFPLNYFTFRVVKMLVMSILLNWII